MSRRFPAGGMFRVVLFLVGLAALGARPVSAQIMDWARYTYVVLDELEYAPGPDENPIILSGELWYGGDYNRLWLKADAERSTADNAGEYELQALYGRFVALYWDAQVGLRVAGEREPDETDVRAHLGLGLQGLAPYWFEVEPALFVSQDGDVSARLEASYELLFTQRLILEPGVELNFAVQDCRNGAWGAA